MNPEDWKTYWRTCHLTPFQIQGLERMEYESIRRPQSERDIHWAVARLVELLGEDIAPTDDDIISVWDSVELQMMGIRP